MKRFMVDATACTGCNLCVIACKDEHTDLGHEPWAAQQPETGQFWIGVQTAEHGVTPRVSVVSSPVFCQHCDNAPCMKVCPENAIKKRPDGLVWIDAEACNGCGLCQAACPYDVIYINEEAGIAQKCTGCAHLVDEGREPRCVEICPHDVISFVDVPADADQPEQGSNILHPEYETRPRVAWLGLPRPRIAGRLLDEKGEEVLEGVEVRAIDLIDDEVVSTTTDSFGEFWLTDLNDKHRYKIVALRGEAELYSTVTAPALGCDLGEVKVKTGAIRSR